MSRKEATFNFKHNETFKCGETVIIESQRLYNASDSIFIKKIKVKYFVSLIFIFIIFNYSLIILKNGIISQSCGK